MTLVSFQQAEVSSLQCPSSFVFKEVLLLFKRAFYRSTAHIQKNAQILSVWSKEFQQIDTARKRALSSRSTPPAPRGEVKAKGSHQPDCFPQKGSSRCSQCWRLPLSKGEVHPLCCIFRPFVLIAD